LLKALNGAVMVAGFVALQAWCALWVFLALRGLQLVGLDGEGALERALMGIAAFVGLGIALATARSAWQGLLRRR